MNEETQRDKGPLLFVQIITLINEADLTNDEFLTLFSMLIVNLVEAEKREIAIDAIKEIVLKRKWNKVV
jgi:hypothetical protein